MHPISSPLLDTGVGKKEDNCPKLPQSAAEKKTYFTKPRFSIYLG